MKKRIDDDLIRVFSVVNSCKSIEQIPAALKYAELWLKKHYGKVHEWSFVKILNQQSY